MKAEMSEFNKVEMSGTHVRLEINLGLQRFLLKSSVHLSQSRLGSWFPKEDYSL